MVTRIRCLGLLAALMVVSTNGTQAAPTETFHNVIVFGDSLSDAGDIKNEHKDFAGNNDWLIIEGKDDIVAPAGAPITSSPNKNPKAPRPLWINLLIEKLTLANGSDRLYLYRHLKDPDYKSAKLDPLHHNLSYAWASAETGDIYIDDSDAESLYPFTNSDCKTPGIIVTNQTACVPSILKQIKLYLADVKNKPNPASLFIIWAGSNDILNNLAKQLSEFMDMDEFTGSATEVSATLLDTVATQPKTAAQEMLSAPIPNLVAALKLLQKKGVPQENIYVINLPNLAKTPAGRYIADDKKEILELIDHATQQYNDNLTTSLIQDNKLIPTDNLISAQNIFNDMLTKPAKYKLKNTRGDCIDDGKGPICNGYLFFKDKNPTIFAGEAIAKSVQETLSKNQ